MFLRILQHAEAGTAPYLVAGDFNTDINAVPALREAVLEGSLMDTGAQEHLTSSSAPLSTCLAHGAKSMSRRDYILISRSLIQFAARASVGESGGFDVHHPVHLVLRFPQDRLQR
eukprot:3180485-Alexandrium_andersonii.AAC.1